MILWTGAGLPGEPVQVRAGRRTADLRGTTLGLCAAFLLFAALPCVADVKAAISLESQYESNSNVFSLQQGYRLLGSNDPRREDTSLRNSGTLRLAYLQDGQRLYVNGTDTDFKYHHFDQYSHHEYNVAGGLDWKLGSALSGNLEASRWRRLAPFADLVVPQLSIRVTQDETARVTLQPGATWKLDATAKNSSIDEPQVGLPYLHLRETSGQAVLTQVKNVGLSAGLSVGYLDADYAGFSAEDSPTYRQTNAAVVWKDAISSRSTFNGRAGFTRRSSASKVNSVAAIVGDLEYNRQLTAKTSMVFLLRRFVDSFVSNASSNVDNIATLNVHWRATAKIAVTAGVGYNYRELPLQGNAPVGADRHDKFQYASLYIDYLPVRWLILKPYANVVTRKSNFVGGNFDASVYGVNLILTWGDVLQH